MVFQESLLELGRLDISTETKRIEFENGISVLADSDSSKNSVIFYMLSAASSLLEYLHLRL